ncbi:cardiotrophin-2-like isoform X2 [Scyliorhinus torazame]|uniref:cardiotrophin-2-like isoform X2 n=1 Tax=Scyliorhinus torazame TaxID=75743 RepID=UPI003B5BD990
MITYATSKPSRATELPGRYGHHGARRPRRLRGGGPIELCEAVPARKRGPGPGRHGARFHRISTRSVTRNLSVTVHKTYKLVQELNHRSPRLVDLYRQHQGPPFNHPGFQPASPALPGLPAVSHGDEEEDGEGKEGIWLLSDHRAYTGLAHYLSLVLEDQRGLNPGRSRLLDELAYFTVNVQGLTVNLEHLASSLDHPRPGVEAYRQAWGPTGTSDWEKKLAGLEVCTRCARWLQASEEDFAALAAKHS